MDFISILFDLIQLFFQIWNKEHILHDLCFLKILIWLKLSFADFLSHLFFGGFSLKFIDLLKWLFMLFWLKEKLISMYFWPKWRNFLWPTTCPFFKKFWIFLHIYVLHNTVNKCTFLIFSKTHKKNSRIFKTISNTSTMDTICFNHDLISRDIGKLIWKWFIGLSHQKTWWSFWSSVTY